MCLNKIRDNISRYKFANQFSQIIEIEVENICASGATAEIGRETTVAMLRQGCLAALLGPA